MLITMLADNPQRYFMIVLAVIISIVLHELAHGWAAIRQGDDTPILAGHMTGNPLVHMGPISILAVLIVGLAWGAMPVNPSRFRSRYGEAIVSFAGPSMNFLLALCALTALGLWRAWGEPAAPGTPAHNAQELLFIFGVFNVALGLFNLAPVPPLDGSNILANLSHGYREWLIRHEQSHQAMFIGYLVLICALAGTGYGIWSLGGRFAAWYVQLLRG